MLTTERPWNANPNAAIAPTDYSLRLVGGAEGERLISIPVGKHSVGSGPRCSLRLQFEGVQPLECLIVHDEAGLRVRRWSEDTQLNGMPFDEASLAAGDVLSVGPVDLEVVVPQAEESFATADEPDTELMEHDSEIVAPYVDSVEPALRSVEEALSEIGAAEDELPYVAAVESQALQPQVTESVWDASVTPEPAAANFNVPVAAETPTANDGQAERRIATSIARRRSRRMLSTIRRQRTEFDELVARVSKLEQSVAQAQREPEQAKFDWDGPVEARESSPQTNEARTEPDPQVGVLEAELGTIRGQLAAREQELAQARYSIDALERQLIDSQHTMHAFAEERVTWEDQFNDLEARLAQYVARIQELERHLDQMRAARSVETAFAPSTSTDWAAESGSSATHVDDLLDAEFGTTVEEQPWDNSASEVAPQDEVLGDTETVEANQAAEETAVETVFEPTETGEESPATTELAAEEPAAELDAALEHLQGLSIWRQEAEVVTEDIDSPTSPDTVEQPEVKPPSAEPASFIDRYAHFFPAEDAVVEPPPPRPTPVAPPVQHAAGDDEESVEQYMAKLMERMRGTTTPDDTDASAAAPAQPAAQDTAAPAAVDACAEPATVEPITSIEELRSKAPPTELASDRMAMRELANQSARHAIGVHTARKLRRTARTRFIVAVLGASVGFYLLLDAPGWKSLQFAAGCVAAFAALYWGKLTLGTLIKGIQVGAFEDIEEPVDPEQSLHPPLPIDVERPKDEPEAASDEAHATADEPQTV